MARRTDDEMVARARDMTRQAIREGLIDAKAPCRVCGDPNAELHHPDYGRPLFLIPLCRTHHRAAHAGEDFGFGAKAQRPWQRSEAEYERSFRQASRSGQRPHGMSYATFTAEMTKRDLLAAYNAEKAKRRENTRRLNAARRAMVAAAPLPTP